jgi:hypothetical protein
MLTAGHSKEMGRYDVLTDACLPGLDVGINNGVVDTAYNFCFVTKDLVLGFNDHKN